MTASPPRYLFDPLPPVALPIQGDDRLFPVRRIYCVGRNYAEHAREMGHDPDREPPFFFQKNPDDLRLDGRFPYPPRSADVQFEVELVAALKAGGRDLTPEAAADAVYGYAVGLDMTRRDLQAAAKKAGRPWEIGKAFAASAPCGPLLPLATPPRSGAITLKQNGVERQRGDLADLIWPIPEVIANLSTLFELRPGDLIFTGTPAGVGPVAPGDALVGEIAGIGRLEVTVV
ncbi:MAG: fumarylacetoacetate hydrolase family protein [Amaricoccus sp.]